MEALVYLCQNVNPISAISPYNISQFGLEGFSVFKNFKLNCKSFLHGLQVGWPVAWLFAWDRPSFKN